MAFSIELYKDIDQQGFVYYVYEFNLPTEPIKNAAGRLRGISKLVRGRVKINKTTGDVDIVELAEGDKGMYIQRAILAIIKHWKNGELPDKTCWAS